MGTVEWMGGERVGCRLGWADWLRMVCTQCTVGKARANGLSFWALPMCAFPECDSVIR